MQREGSAYRRPVPAPEAPPSNSDCKLAGLPEGGVEAAGLVSVRDGVAAESNKDWRVFGLAPSAPDDAGGCGGSPALAPPPPGCEVADRG